MLPESKKPIIIPGPAGNLELLVSLPKNASDTQGAVVICHPHPLKEGTMHNKVVHYLAKTFNDCGYGAVRFNFRGVGLSEGSYGEGLGESEDALSVIRWTQNQIGSLPIWLAGFSFGGYVALNCSTQSNAKGLITVAPAVNLLDFRSLKLPDIPWLMVHGDQDDVVPFHDALDWYSEIEEKPEFKVLDNAGHFFHGQLNELRDIVKDFIINS